MKMKCVVLEKEGKENYFLSKAEAAKFMGVLYPNFLKYMKANKRYKGYSIYEVDIGDLTTLILGIRENTDENIINI